MAIGTSQDLMYKFNNYVEYLNKEIGTHLHQHYSKTSNIIYLKNIQETQYAQVHDLDMKLDTMEFKKYKIDLCIPEYMYAHNGYDAVLEELHKKLMSSLHIHNDTKKLVYIGIAGDIKGCKHVNYETFSHKFSLSFLLGIKEFLIED